MSTGAIVLLAVLGAVVLAGAAFYFGRRAERRLAEAVGRAAAQQSERMLADAQREAETLKAQTVLAGKEEVIRAREEWESEEKGRREDVGRLERRLEERAMLLDKKHDTLDENEGQVKRREQSVRDKEKHLRDKEEELTTAIEEHRARLEQLAGISASEAKDELVKEMTDEARSEAAAIVRDLKEEAKRNADREAKKIIATTIQRLASEHATEISTSAVSLPNDEMKGRIIGREGRNIRAFETATGGIHPGRIEEVVAKQRERIEAELIEAGEQAVYDVGIHGMHAELIKLVGRMKYRTSYGQNIYDHSKEVAWLAGMMAGELRLDVNKAKRGGLLHDIGKVLTHQSEGTHVELGVEMAKKYGEDPVVVNAIAAHHDDVAHESPISVIVQAADAASGARPGARREAFETYVKRLTRLEEIANGFKGVEKTFAIQAGREIRIVVSPDSVNDTQAAELSEEIARKIEDELQYPGQIKVVVVRETRAVDFAR
jgi:ribonuclease Y